MWFNLNNPVRSAGDKKQQNQNPEVGSIKH